MGSGTQVAVLICENALKNIKMAGFIPQRTDGH